MNVKVCNFCDTVIKNTDVEAGNYHNITVQKGVPMNEITSLDEVFKYFKKHNKNEEPDFYEICSKCYKILDMLLYHRQNKIKNEVKSIKRMLNKKNRENKILKEK